MNKIKRLVKTILPRPVFVFLKTHVQLFCLNRKNAPAFCKTVLIWPSSKKDRLTDFVRQFGLMCKKLRFSVDSFYVYPFDPGLVRVLPDGVTCICSITPDFGKILTSNLNELSKELAFSPDPFFADREEKIIESISLLASRISNSLRTVDLPRARQLAKYFPEILFRKPTSLDEAIQKILFYDALFWQAKHMHIGLGRLDKILFEYYESDLSKGIISEKEAKNLLKEMLLTLHKDMRYKSLGMNGDTGQYILLGGSDSGGSTVQNNLTLLFLELIKELRIPDPKLILRVNEQTNDEVWDKSIIALLSGGGSPLFMNETPIMKGMVVFGYDKKDVFQLGTSACWEPLIIGKSFDQNNPFRSASPLMSLNKLLLANECDYTNFHDLLTSYKEAFSCELRDVVRDVIFDCSPLFSLFFDNCIKRGKDFTMGGAIYSYHGVQVVGLPNLVNALLNIKEVVYEKHLYTLNQCREAIRKNFSGYEDLHTLLLSTQKKYGSSVKEVVDLTNELMEFTGRVLESCLCNGKKVKVGFSSPNYVDCGYSLGATLDGRFARDPLAVHISPTSSMIDISEVLDFASHLNYSNNRINGNVVDFILPRSYVAKKDKLIGILKNAIRNGVFELQLNVLDRKTLVDAKVHPEKYPNLIVRVWGFSAYFNDLPEAFKDNLIHRAEIYEVA